MAESNVVQQPVALTLSADQACTLCVSTLPRSGKRHCTTFTTTSATMLPRLDPVSLPSLSFRKLTASTIICPSSTPMKANPSIVYRLTIPVCAFPPMLALLVLLDGGTRTCLAHHVGCDTSLWCITGFHLQYGAEPLYRFVRVDLCQRSGGGSIPAQRGWRHRSVVRAQFCSRASGTDGASACSGSWRWH